MSFNGKTAVITGASRGIGRAIAEVLAERGADIVVADINEAQAQSTAQEIAEATGRRALPLMVNVSDLSNCQAMIDKALAEFGKVDILVNNAGITRDNLIMMMSENDWDNVISTNLKSTYNCSKAAVRHMMRKRYGRIVNITSVSGQMGNAGQTNYSASKAGQIGFTKALAREVASRNITVNAIAAGYVETEIWANVSEEVRQSILNIIPLGRKGEPEEIAYAVAFLASDQAAYITGQILGIDGGMAMM